MDVVLDTASLHRLLCRPRRTRGRIGGRWSLETPLDEPIRGGRVAVALDRAQGLVSEWEQTCGRELVGVVLARWEPLRGILIIDTPPPLGGRITRRLRCLGFRDTVDKLVLRLALAIRDRVIVSDDSDFWDPRRRDSRGDRNACVARLCRDELQVTVLVLGMLIRVLDGQRNIRGGRA